jgi:hypothetical protein
LLKAKKLLNKQVEGEELTSIDVALAHDYVDMVIDDIVLEEFEKKTKMRSIQEILDCQASCTIGTMATEIADLAYKMRNGIDLSSEKIALRDAYFLNKNPK